MEKSYFNTTKLTGEELKDSEGKALTQEQKVMVLFDRFPKGHLAPHEVHHILGLTGTPLTSIRRAMTQLTKKGKLIKTDKVVDGAFGKPSFTWMKSC